jgi:hypothetical protein
MQSAVAGSSCATSSKSWGAYFERNIMYIHRESRTPSASSVTWVAPNSNTIFMKSPHE